MGLSPSHDRCAVPPFFGVSNAACLPLLDISHNVTAQDPGRLALVSARTFNPHCSSMTVYLYGYYFFRTSLHLKMSVEKHRFRSAHRNLTNNWSFLSCARLLDW